MADRSGDRSRRGRLGGGAGVGASRGLRAALVPVLQRRRPALRARGGDPAAARAHRQAPVLLPSFRPLDRPRRRIDLRPALVDLRSPTHAASQAAAAPGGGHVLRLGLVAARALATVVLDLDRLGRRYLARVRLPGLGPGSPRRGGRSLRERRGPRAVPDAGGGPRRRARPRGPGADRFGGHEALRPDRPARSRWPDLRAVREPQSLRGLHAAGRSDLSPRRGARLCAATRGGSASAPI